MPRIEAERALALCPCAYASGKQKSRAKSFHQLAQGRQPTGKDEIGWRLGRNGARVFDGVMVTSRKQGARDGHVRDLAIHTVLSHVIT